MSRIAYRPDIDGLRAVAISLVFLNHLQAGFFSGGYIGVDVFFVISGFLITSIIAREIKLTSQFKLYDFYIGRVRRLLPAIVATCFVVLLFASLVSTQEQFIAISRSIPGVLFSFSNIMFWLQQGYFDTSSLTKPLLHAWSLSVEEQFYLFWPVTLLLLTRFLKNAAVLWIVIIGIFVGSFLLNWIVFDTQFFYLDWFDIRPLDRFRSPGNAAYFLTPFRIFEFGFGICLALCPRGSLSRLPIWAVKLMFCAGMLCILIPAIVLDEKSIFPYYNALLPCVGTVLLIMAGERQDVRTFLYSRAALYLGKTSYSLYLVHWPVIVFYHDLTVGDLVFFDKLCIVTIALLLSHLLHKYIEQPLRSKPLMNSAAEFRVGSSSIVAFALVLAIFTMFAPDILSDRIPESRQYKTNKQWRDAEWDLYCESKNPKMPVSIFSCQNYHAMDREIIIWGDSHALHLVGGFSELFPDYDIYVATLEGCIPQSGFENYVRHYGRKDQTERCIQRNHDMVRFLETAKSMPVIITSAKRKGPARMADINNKLIEKIESFGHRVAVMEDFVIPGVQFGQCINRPDILVPYNYLKSLCAVDPEIARKDLKYNQALQLHSHHYISVDQEQCIDGDCVFIDDLGNPTHRDDHHLSIDGSIYLLKKLVLSISSALNINARSQE